MAVGTSPPPASPPPLWRKTPLVESAKLSQAAGCRILLKLDLHQPSGSFKSRGIGAYCAHALRHSPHPERTHFYSSSGGNAGLAAVAAARALGRPCSVVVPTSTKPLMVAALHAAGAHTVIQTGADWKAADTYMRAHVMPAAAATGVHPISVHPFDDPVIWGGNGTLVPEIEAQLADLGDPTPPDVVIASVGGGGLFSGLAQELFEDPRRARAWPRTTLLAVETQGAESLARALEADDECTTLPGITSRATSLGATRVAGRTFALARKWAERGRVRNAVLSDAEAAMGCWRFADDERLLVEMACGVNLALCYGGRLERALGRKVGKEEKVVVVVCGGSNVTTGMVEGWRREFGDLVDGEVDGEGMEASLGETLQGRT